MDILLGNFVKRHIDNFNEDELEDIKKILFIKSRVAQIDGKFNLNKRLKQIFDKRLKFDENLIYCTKI